MSNAVLHIPGEITVIDDFYGSARSQRNQALQNNEFDTVEFKGHPYQGVGLTVSDGDWEMVERAVRFPISPARYGDQDATFYRLGREGDEPTTWIHPDTGMDATWAALCYLSDPPDESYGTAFWRHRVLGDRLPPHLRSDPEALSTLDEHGQDERYWMSAGIVFQKMNRFVAYPTAKFHSRWPKYPAGATKEEGRLVRVWFFSEREDSKWLSPPPP